MAKVALWYRFYTDTPDDTKLRSLPIGYRWLWTALMALAKESPEPGRLLLKGGEVVTEQMMADKAGPGISVGEVRKALILMGPGHRAMVHQEDQVWVLTNFQKRQYLSDSSQKRVAEHRRRRSNGTSNADAPLQTPALKRPPSHARSVGPESREQRTDLPPSEHQPERQASRPTEQSAPPAARVEADPPGDPQEPGYTAEFAAFWRAYPRRIDKADAFAAFEKALKRRNTTAELLRVAAENFATYCDEMRTEAKVIPYASTWLNKLRFLEFLKRDAMPEAETRRGGHGNGHGKPSALRRSTANLRSLLQEDNE